MAKWTDYTTDTNPTDTDEVMTLDADKSPKANKRVTLSTLADYFLDKLASKVFAKLETKNKTVIGALNELNSKAHDAVRMDIDEPEIENNDIVAAIKKNIEKFQDDVFYYGFVGCGMRFQYYGYVILNHKYASFVFHSYGQIVAQIRCANGEWQ